MREGTGKRAAVSREQQRRAQEGHAPFFGRVARVSCHAADAQEGMASGQAGFEVTEQRGKHVMTMHDHSQHGSHRSEDAAQGSFFASRGFLVLLAFLAMALVLLFSEHRAHFLGVLPFLFILACPLLHMFMHGGHGSHGGDTGERS